MIFTVILICVLGRDFGLMLRAERASQASPTGGTISEASRSQTVSNEVSPPNDDNEQESSMDASEKGENCCHRRRHRNNNTTTNNLELQRYSNQIQEEDSTENLYTGMCVCLRICAYVIFLPRGRLVVVLRCGWEKENHIKVC